MAEIAAIFHWSYTELAAMPFDELVGWRNRAVAIYNRMNAPAKK
jgi:Phage P2 GpE